MRKRRLLLWRHAKSSWDNSQLDDFERPLNKRGKRARIVMAKYMAENGLLPDLVLCSPAKRTRKTLKALKRYLPKGTRIVFEDTLYREEANYRSIIKAYEQGEATIMVIGHNMTMQLTALSLVEPGRDEPYKRMLRKFPTAALAVIDWGDGKAFPDKSGRLVSFVCPRDFENEPSSR